MCKLLGSILIGTTLLLALSAVPGEASSLPTDVSILVTTYFLDTGNSGPFIASGPAVTDGIICPEGIATDIYNRGSGYQSKWGAANYLVLKEFTCDDGSGSFILKIEARVDWRGDNGPWNVFSGSGSYEKLHGAGSLYGEYFFDDEDNVIGVYDYVSGKVH